MNNNNFVRPQGAIPEALASIVLGTTLFLPACAINLAAEYFGAGATKPIVTDASSEIVEVVKPAQKKTLN